MDTAKQRFEEGDAHGAAALTVPDLGMEFVHVGPGSFQMGSSAGDLNEQPVHEVQITREFWLGRYAVTNGEYQAFVKTSGYDGRGDADSGYLGHHKAWGSCASTGARHPIVAVSWSNAAAFCTWLTERERATGRLAEGCVYRLPTEAEWEYAARGGNRSQGFSYAGSNRLHEVAWYGSNSKMNTHPVGRKRANELGLFDMSGNVCEWCHDWDGEYPSGSATDPTGPVAGSFRIARGGSWRSGAFSCRLASRGDSGSPADTCDERGFRVLLGAPVCEVRRLADTGSSEAGHPEGTCGSLTGAAPHRAPGPRQGRRPVVFVAKDEGSLARLMAALLSVACGCDAVVVTCGESGYAAFEEEVFRRLAEVKAEISLIINGFNLMDSVTRYQRFVEIVPACPVIVVTAWEPAWQALESDPGRYPDLADILRLPFTVERFREAVAKALGSG